MRIITVLVVLLAAAGLYFMQVDPRFRKKAETSERQSQTAKKAVNAYLDNAWRQQGRKLVGTGSVGPALQGSSVSISADGNTIAFGGWYDNAELGAVWIFAREGNAWKQVGSKLVGSEARGRSREGFSVALSGDGKTLAIGGPKDNYGEGSVWIFTYKNGAWIQEGSKLKAHGADGDANLGFSVSISFDGNTLIAGGFADRSNSGAAWVFVRQNGLWKQFGAKLVGTGAVGKAQQGISVSISSDGKTALVGGIDDDHGTGATWVFSKKTEAWTQEGQKLIGFTNTGPAKQGLTALSGDGNVAIIGGFNDDSGTGTMWIFLRRYDLFWIQHGSKFTASSAIGKANLGRVSISSDGKTALVGGLTDSSEQGASWVFEDIPGLPTEIGKLVGDDSKDGPAFQGDSVAINSDGTTAVSCGSKDESREGACWVFVRKSETSSR